MLATESEFVKEVCANVPFYKTKLDLMTGRWYITIMSDTCEILIYETGIFSASALVIYEWWHLFPEWHQSPW